MIHICKSFFSCCGPAKKPLETYDIPHDNSRSRESLLTNNHSAPPFSLRDDMIQKITKYSSNDNHDNLHTKDIQTLILSYKKLPISFACPILMESNNLCMDCS